ncbi:hypothetical protein BDR06DRAFT_1045256 [Suillus hirtellus]|nr:hypothetical protein BDR06DRAFT_1045256 [Suillus hirtellus]
MSQAAVHLSLSQKEASDLEYGVDDSLHSNISPNILIYSGMDYGDQHLSKHKWDLQRAQAFDALNDSTGTSTFEHIYTSSKTLKFAVIRDTWTTELPKLEEGDIQGIGDSAFGESSRNHTLLWIWKVQGVATIGMESEAVLLEVRWCRLRACANWWAEEVELLLEEMQHWDKQATQRVGLDDASLKGIQGYAKCQVAQHRSMRDVFLTKWSIVPTLLHPEATAAPV